MATVFVPTMLQAITGGVKQVEVEAANVRQVIDRLEELYPGIKHRLVEEGKVDAVVIDFADNARRHKLVTVLDLFGTTDKDDAAGEDVLGFVDRELAEQERQLLIDW